MEQEQKEMKAITFDGQLIANAVTALLQSEEQINLNEFFTFIDLARTEEGFVMYATKDTVRLDS
jgi:hypothetical protein